MYLHVYVSANGRARALSRAHHFRLSALPNAPLLLSLRPDVIYGFGVSSMDFWITARQMTTVPRGK